MLKTIHTPGVVSVEDHDAVNATFTIEPLHTGYGMTLGNSIRRVLLGSISGSAITSFKIEGASHEFTSVAGVKEDVVDIMINLKGVRFRVFGNDAVTLRISKKGKGKVTAKDIQSSADVEVVNPDHIIATLDDDKTNFVMDLTVETGRGYRSIEDSSVNKPSDMIALDAIFTPVPRVRYKVEHTRVGQMTNLDKLLITITTDGSITPRDAFKEAAAILINQYTALAGQTRVEAIPHSSSSVDAEEFSEDSESNELMTSIEDLNFSARTTNALINNDIHTLKDLFALSDVELRDLKGFGSKALDEVKDKMAELEL